MKIKKRIDLKFYSQLIFASILGLGGVLLIYISLISLGIILITLSVTVFIDIFIKYQIPKKILTEIHYGSVVEIFPEKIDLEFDKFITEDGPLKKTFKTNDFDQIPRYGEILQVKIILKKMGS